jgi:phage gp36-like protein
MPVTPIAVCAQQDVVDFIGGMEKAIEAFDQDRTGNLNTTLIAKAISAASADVEAAVGERYVIWGASAFPYKITRLGTILAVYYGYFIATGGRSIPDGVRQAMLDARQELERIESGKGSPGSPKPPARSFPAQVDNSAGGTRAVYCVFRRGGMLGGR